MPVRKEINLAEAIIAYENGETFESIAKKNGVSGGFIKGRLIEAGVEFRTRQEVDVAAIVDAYESGKNMKEIAKENGVSASIIKHRLLAAGVNIRKQKELNMDAIIDEYQQGESYETIGKTHGVSSSTIKSRLVNAGISLRSTEQADKLQKVDWANIAKQYEEGKSLSELKGITGFTQETIRKRITKHGVTIRPKAPSLDREWEEAKRLYEAGWMIKDLAEKFQTNRETLKKYLRQLGVKFKHVDTNREHVLVDWAIIAKRYEDGEKISVMATETNYSEELIRQRIIEQGVIMNVSNGNKVTDEMEREFCRLYKGGKQTKEISELYGVSQNCIYRYLHKYDIKLHHSPTTKETREELVSLYQSGWSTEQIGKYVGKSQCVIRYHLNKAGILLPQKKMDATQTEEIIALYKGGDCIKEIATEYDMTREGIKALLQRHNISLQSTWLTETQAATMAQQYIDGRSIDDLAGIYSLNPNMVVYYLTNFGNGVYNRKYPINHEVFQIVTQRSAYWIGFMMADGNVTGDRIVQISLAIKDEEHLRKFYQFVGSDERPIIYKYNPGTKRVPTPGWCADARIISKPMVKDLATHGIIPNKTLVTEAPKHLQNNPAFWLGCVDGDGWVSSKDNSRFCIGLSGTEKIVSQFGDFIVDIVGGIKTVVGNERSSNCYRTVYVGERAKKALRIMYNSSPEHLERKRQNAISHGVI